MKQFEYKIDDLKVYTQLIEYGKNGWELVQLTEKGIKLHCIFKREVPPKHEENKQDALSKFSYEEMQGEMNRRYRSAIPFNK